ncbi:MAG: hypothetical protein PUB95_05265 [Methanobrevibacter ruminantium]|uniref:hypothetical protein n=1 Tax=Methanobrevibacter ruminantium TaxID=83816 RepID=UPI0026EB2D08|nr:hypothetical protein [Methanobrevibacter ruminantium]MDD6048844.1 hypothetical protein [Methanobrevibacter ruminantium]
MQKDVFDLGFNTALRFKIISIPIVGNYIDVAYTESIQTIRERILKNSIEKLDEKKIDKEYLNSFEFLNLLVLTYKMALDEIGLDKIIFFSKLIKNSLESSEEERKYNFDYIKIVHELSIDQMHLLHEIYIQQKDLYKFREEYPDYTELNLVHECTDWKNLPKILNDKYMIDEDDLNFLLKRTESTGLIREITGTYLNYDGGTYIMNETLRKFMDRLDIVVMKNDKLIE